MSACVSGLLEGLSYTSLDAFLRGNTITAAILRLALAGLALAGLALGHGGLALGHGGRAVDLLWYRTVRIINTSYCCASSKMHYYIIINVIIISVYCIICYYCILPFTIVYHLLLHVLLLDANTSPRTARLGLSRISS